MPKEVESTYWVYVIQSQQTRVGKRGKTLPGFFYVGSTTDPLRRLRQHNGEISGGGKYTSTKRPWKLMAVWGPYAGRGEGLRAEMNLKRTKRGTARLSWSPSDSPLCRGLGQQDPRVLLLQEVQPSQKGPLSKVAL
jgi:predicted GIY-YIG superfamily endonuclease